MKYPIIGLAGAAQSGKDTFCNLLIAEFKKMNLRAKRYALADALKDNLNPFLIEKCGIDIWNCTSEEKELIRPLMVEYGMVKRMQTQGRYWTDIVQNRMIADIETVDIPIITDIRYDKYKYDEIHFLQESNKGILVYIKRYKLIEKTALVPYPPTPGSPVDIATWEYILAPNKEEAENCPKLEKKADYIVDWESVGIENLNLQAPHAQKFIEWLKKEGHLEI